MIRRRTIRHRLLREYVPLILILGGALVGTTFVGARRTIETLSQRIMERAAGQAESELRRFFDPVALALAALRSWGELDHLSEDDPEALRALIQPLADPLPQISGALLADENGSELFLSRVDGGWRQRVTRVEDSQTRTEWLDPAPQPVGTAAAARSGDYDPRTRPWFEGALAARNGAIYWSEPYLFFTRQEQGMTASAAYRSPDGRNRVVAFDVSLADLSSYIRGIEVSANGLLWILDEDRRLLAWTENPEVWGGRDPSAALLLRPRDLGLPLIDDAVRVLGERTVEDLGEPLRFTSGGRGWWAAGRRFALSGDRSMLIAVVVPHADLLGDRVRLRWWIIAATLFVLLLAVGRAYVLARRFSEPIEVLACESDRLSQGDLEAGEPVRSEFTEVQDLADAHERMRLGLKTLMKLEGELQIARQIQQKTFPRELPRIAGFDLIGWSQPADETGGDSYDVIGLAADGTIAAGDVDGAVLMLADATGHGIGPALSVTQLRAMLRMAVRTDSDLREMAAHMNEQLYADLPGNRFITAWLGLLRADGSLSSFAAGQAPLLIYRAASGEVEVRDADAPPFGLLPPMPVVMPAPTELEAGDIYVVLSDGFYEAVDAEGDEFGVERVAEIIRSHSRSGAEEILAALRARVADFTRNAPLDDDRTAVIIKRES